MKSFLRKFIAAFSALVVLLVLVVNAALIWVATGPRSLMEWVPYIESSLLPPEADFKVKVGDAVLLWEGWRHPMDIRLKKIALLTSEGTVFATFPEISAGIDIPALLIGRLKFSSLIINKPIVSLYRDEQGHVGLGMGGEAKTQFSLLENLRLLYGKGGDGSIKSISIRGADLSIGNIESGVFLSAPKVDLELIKIRSGLKGVLSIATDYKGEVSRLTANMIWKAADNRIEGALGFVNVLPGMLSEVLPGSEMLNAFDLAMNGTANVAIAGDGTVELLGFDLSANNGTYTNEAYFPKPLILQKLIAKGRFSDNLNRLDMEQVSIQFDKPLVTLTGSVLRVDDVFDIAATANVTEMPIDELYKYWPVTVYPISREWVVTNITTGTVEKADASLTLKPDDIKNDTIPDDAFAAVLQVKNATVDYLTGYPKVTGVTGKVIFNSRKMVIEADSGAYMSGSTLKAGKVVIDDFHPDEPVIDLDLDIAANAKDVADYLHLLDLSVVDYLALSPAAISGKADGKLKLRFPLLAQDPPKGKEFNHVDYTITTNLSSVSHKKLMGMFDVENATGKLAIDKKQVTLDASGAVNGVPSSVSLAGDIDASGKAKSIHYNIKADTVPADALPRFGYPALPGLTGNLAVTAEMDEVGSKKTTRATIDLTNAALSIPEINYSKQAGIKSQLVIASTQSGQQAAIDKFTFSSPGLNTSGSALMAADFSDVIRFSLNGVRYRNNDFSLSYDSSGGMDNLTLQGSSIDLSGYFAKKDSSFSTSDYASLGININMDRVVLSGDKEARGVKGHLSCNQSICPSADIRGVIGKNAFSYVISKQDGKRELLMSADDAGEFLQAFNISSNIRSGVMKLTGVFDDAASNHPLKGKLLISDYELYNAPVLTKLLTVGSFTGLVDTVSGKGIAFKKMSIPFTLENDKVTIKDAKTFGPALGITADGTLNLKSYVLDIKGTLVPAYTLNSVFGKIPLIGALAGGEGQGLFAANYHVKGTHTDPDISLNPLSILTPGFLRGLFDIVDTSSPEDDDTETDKE